MLVIFFFHPFPSITSFYKLFSSWPAVARNPGSPNELFSSWPSFARNPCPPVELFSPWPSFARNPDWLDELFSILSIFWKKSRLNSFPLGHLLQDFVFGLFLLFAEIMILVRGYPLSVGKIASFFKKNCPLSVEIMHFTIFKPFLKWNQNSC